ncbi:hypothetical protein ACSF86_01545 [Moraxella bovoculi]
MSVTLKNNAVKNRNDIGCEDLTIPTKNPLMTKGFFVVIKAWRITSL